MEGQEEVTMDGKTAITWVLGPRREARCIRPQRLAAGLDEPVEALRAKLIAATVELAATGSNPRLIETR